MTEQTALPPDGEIITADTPGPWWRNPTWWPLLTLVPILALAAVCGHAAKGMDEADDRIRFVLQGGLEISIGTMLYVWLIASISGRWNGGAKTMLSLTTSGVLAVGGAIWFGATFKTITARPALAFFWTPEPWASGAKGLQLCVGWGVLLICAVVYLAFDSKRKRRAAEQVATETVGTSDSGG